MIGRPQERAGAAGVFAEADDTLQSAQGLQQHEHQQPVEGGAVGEPGRPPALLLLPGGH